MVVVQFAMKIMTMMWRQVSVECFSTIVDTIFAENVWQIIVNWLFKSIGSSPLRVLYHPVTKVFQKPSYMAFCALLKDATIRKPASANHGSSINDVCKWQTILLSYPAPSVKHFCRNKVTRILSPVPVDTSFVPFMETHIRT